ncbi:MAG TPA: response regulator [Pirellulales bacterium]|nr:response regulator [Pirellulales bacterium]
MSTSTPHVSTRILVIEDQAEVVDGLTAMLAAAGYDCHSAADDHTAADLAARVHPDLILCDINLHGTSGLELCDQLKQLEGMADVPTMFLSGAQMPDIIRRAHAWHVRKLLDPTVILKLIEQALAENSARQLTGV